MEALGQAFDWAQDMLAEARADRVFQRAGRPAGTTGRVLVGVLLTLLVCARWSGAEAAEPVGRRIVAIDFVCTAAIDREGLRALMPMKVGEELGPGEIEQARWRLEQTGIFTQVAIAAESRDEGVAVVARLTRKQVVNTVRFHGNETISSDQLGRIVRVYPGAMFSDELRDYGVQRIRERYAVEGFDRVQVSAAVREPRVGEVEVTYLIEEGEPLRVGAVEINGAVPIASETLRTATKMSPGDRYTRTKHRVADKAILRALRRARYYEAQVDSHWEVGPAHTGTVRFTIIPGPPFVVEFAGNRRFSDGHLLDLLDLPARPIVTDGTWRELGRRAQHAYQDLGYYYAQVELHIEPGPPKRVRFEINEGRRFRIAEVSFEGNRGLSTADLQAAMATRPPSWIPWRRGVLLDDVLADDLKRLWQLYRQRGFQAAEIVDARTRFDGEDGKIFLTVVIEEGPRTIVERIERVGLAPIAAAVPELTVREGQPLNPDEVEADRRVLVTALAQAGYPHAEVTTEVDTSPREAIQVATVRFVAVPGPAERVGAIIVENNIDTKARVVLRELPFKRGDPLDPDALLRAQTNLYRLGLFRSVTVRPLEHGSTENLRDIGISVAEKPPGTMQWGVGYNTRDGIRGFGEIGHNNLQGLGRRLSLRGEFSLDVPELTPNEYLGDLAFREPRLGDTKWTVRTDLIAQRSTRKVDQFSVERLALVPAIERTLLPNLRVGMELQIEQSQVFDVADDVLAFNPRDQGRLREISLGPFVVYDGRDDAFIPRRGVFDSLRVRYAPRELGSDIPFVKLIGQHSHYIPLSEDLTFVYVARGGWANVLDSDSQLPIRERFFLGGRTTVRGFGENVLGPQGAHSFDSRGRVVGGGNPLGGDMVANLNSELRFPIAFGAGGAVFADGGGVYLQDRAVTLRDFRRAAGLGLRYNTPVGPISLDYGFKLDRRPDESVGEVHFSIGAIF